MSLEQHPYCPYCGQQSLLRMASDIYGSRYRGAGNLYVCPSYPACDSYVGCNRDTNKPLGRMANRELRLAKRSAHRAFDALWMTKIKREGVSRKHARTAGYVWLAGQLGIELSACHIGMMDVESCKQVVSVCAPYHRGGAVK